MYLWLLTINLLRITINQSHHLHEYEQKALHTHDRVQGHKRQLVADLSFFFQFHYNLPSGKYSTLCALPPLRSRLWTLCNWQWTDHFGMYIACYTTVYTPQGFLLWPEVGCHGPPPSSLKGSITAPTHIWRYPIRNLLLPYGVGLKGYRGKSEIQSVNLGITNIYPSFTSFLSVGFNVPHRNLANAPPSQEKLFQKVRTLGR